MRARSDEFAVEVARIAVAYDLMHRWREAQLLQHYAVKLAGLAIGLLPGEVAAAVAALRAERDAAIEALHMEKQKRQQGPLGGLVQSVGPKRRDAVATTTPGCQGYWAGAVTQITGEVARSSERRLPRVPRRPRTLVRRLTATSRELRWTAARSRMFAHFSL